MGGSNSKDSTFDEHPKYYIDAPRKRDHRILYWKSWQLEVEGYDGWFSIEVSRLFSNRQKYELVYQITTINKYYLRKKLVIRGVEKLRGTHDYFEVLPVKCPLCCEPSYNQFNFQAFAYAIIENNGLRKLNFEDENVYGKSITVLTSGESLEIPIQFVNVRAPLLATYINTVIPNPGLNSCSEKFFQVFHGVQLQLKKREIQSLLKLAAKFQVLNVKRYCERQLIWRDDFKLSEKRKFELACKYNLNILMNHLLRNVKTVEELAKLVSISIEMMPVNANISKLLVAKMYEIS